MDGEVVFLAMQKVSAYILYDRMMNFQSWRATWTEDEEFYF